MKLALLVIVVMGMLDAALGECQSPDQPENGYVQVTYANSNGDSEGMEITYNCLTGYILDTQDNGGFSTNKCSLGAWENEPPVCREDCNNPQSITNGFVDLASYGDHLYAEYSCINEYDIVDLGDETFRQCTAGGFLDGELPTCYKSVGCLPPPDIDSFEHGTIDYYPLTPTSGLSGDALFYLCDNGYTLRDFTYDTYRPCKYPDWVGPEPYCELAGYCKKPVDPENGHASYSDHRNGFNVTYSCDAGYELHGGDAFQMCIYFETWTNETGAKATVPTCVKLDSDSGSGSGSDSGHVVPWRSPEWRDNKYKGNAELREKRRGWCKSYLNRHYKSHFWHPYQD